MAAPTPCADCQVNEGSFEIRKRWLCSVCFLQYVNVKVLKQMTAYRPKLQEDSDRPNLIACLSGGVSSLVTLLVLDEYMQRQKQKRNRVSFDLTLVHVTLPEIVTEEKEANWRQSVGSRFASHQFLDPIRLCQVFSTDLDIEAGLRELGIVRRGDLDDDAFLHQVLSQAKTPTARTELLEILLQRLIVATARKQKSQGIIWGHSDSRLAAKTLADVAKGRGGSVSDHIMEGSSVHGMIFHHPVRDLFSSELELYLKLIPDDLSNCLLKSEELENVPPSIRLTSIDSLLTNYIKTQGEKYPGVMANVVRTAAKLEMPANTNQRCVVCSMHITTATMSQILCYGCEQLKQDIVKT